MSKDKVFPEGMVPLGGDEFTFLCHPGVDCFTACCRNVDLDLYPYDIIRLKQNLKMDSGDFLRQHTRLKEGGNPFFPTVALKLTESGEESICPFLDDEGCTVYRDRPTSCRTYPLERAVDRLPEQGRPTDYYFLTDHAYCHGHREDHRYTVKKWVRNQRLDEFNLMNDLWAEIETVFAGNPWKGEGVGGSRQQISFMVCYDIDGFRRMAEKERLISHFNIDRDRKRRIEKDDAELLKFGFEWLKYFLTGSSAITRS